MLSPPRSKQHAKCAALSTSTSAAATFFIRWVFFPRTHVGNVSFCHRPPLLSSRVSPTHVRTDSNQRPPRGRRSSAGGRQSIGLHQPKLIWRDYLQPRLLFFLFPHRSIMQTPSSSGTPAYLLLFIHLCACSTHSLAVERKKQEKKPG